MTNCQVGKEQVAEVAKVGKGQVFRVTEVGKGQAVRSEKGQVVRIFNMSIFSVGTGANFQGCQVCQGSKGTRCQDCKWVYFHGWKREEISGLTGFPG